MISCSVCGADNVDGTRFCVKCGAALPTAPAPGSWQAPSGNLYDTPNTGSQSGSINNPSGGLGSGGYAPPAPAAYGYPQGIPGPGGQNYALWADRVLAALIDGALIMAGVILLYFVIAVIGGIGSAALGAISQDAGGIFGFGACCTFFILPPLATLLVNLYNKVYLISSRGYSIGQGIMNLKVLMADGSPVSLNTSILRALVQLGLGVVPFLGWILIPLDLLFPLWDPQHQTLHDKAVGTVVVKRS